MPRDSPSRRPMDDTPSNAAGAAVSRDWVGNTRTYMIAWGIPTFALIVGIFLPPKSSAIVWAVALTWMGLACILNALRCGRLHCYLTGPFFLFMAGASLLHGFEIVWLGTYGCLWLTLALIVVGGGLFWYVPERMWGKYSAGSQKVE